MVIMVMNLQINLPRQLSLDPHLVHQDSAPPLTLCMWTINLWTMISLMHFMGLLSATGLPPTTNVASAKVAGFSLWLIKLQTGNHNNPGLKINCLSSRLTPIHCQQLLMPTSGSLNSYCSLCELAGIVPAPVDTSTHWYMCASCRDDWLLAAARVAAQVPSLQEYASHILPVPQSDYECLTWGHAPPYLDTTDGLQLHLNKTAQCDFAQAWMAYAHSIWHACAEHMDSLPTPGPLLAFATATSSVRRFFTPKLILLLQPSCQFHPHGCSLLLVECC